jgi:hypothetical protein
MRKAHVSLAVAICALFVIVYSHTSAVSVSWKNFSEDSGDLLTSAYTLGIPHPTGYPLYVLLGRVFSLVAPGGVAFRITLLSLVAASLAPVFLFLALVGILPGRNGIMAALAGALSLGLSAHYWSQAVVAEVYSLQVLLLSIVVFLMLGWAQQPTSRPRYLLLASYVMGLSFANHLLSVLTLVFAAIVFFWPSARPRITARTLLACTALFLLALTVYAYLPIRSAGNPELDWGNPETWTQFKWLVSGAQYRFRLLAAPFPQALFKLWPGPFLSAGWPLLGLAVVGLAFGATGNRLRAALLAVIVFDLAVVALYEIPDPEAYFLPSCFALSMAAAVGIARIASGLEFSSRRPAADSRTATGARGLLSTCVAAVLLLACAVVPAVENARKVDASTDLTPYVFGQATFRVVEPNALILSEYDGRTFALWFFRETEFRNTHAGSVVVFKYLLVWPWYVENLRKLHPDLRVPDAGPMDTASLALVSSNIDSRPVYTVRDDPALKPFFELRPILGGNTPLFKVEERIH